MESRPRFAWVIIYYVRLSISASVGISICFNTIASLLSILLGGFFLPLFTTGGSKFFRDNQGRLFHSCKTKYKKAATKNMIKR
jgi:hypothetical protein